MTRTRYFQLLVALTIGVTPLFSDAGDSISRGWGNQKCSNITGLGPQKDFFGETYPIPAEALSWSVGYLSALSFAEAAHDASSSHAYNEGFGDVSLQRLASAIAQMCKEKPLSNLRGITRSIYRQIGGRLYLE